VRENKIQARRREAWLKVLNTKEGREVLGEIMQTAGIFARNGNTQNITMAYQEGQRSIATYVFTTLFEYDSNSFLKIIAENNDLEKEKIKEENEEE